MGLGHTEIIFMVAIFIVVVIIPIVLLFYLIVRLRGDNKSINDHETSPFFSSDFIDNQRKILEMIQQGKVGIDDGEKLFAEINKKALLETSASKSEKQLRRRSDNRQLGGVCGAIADYFEINSTLVRLGFVLLAIITGGGAVIFYIIASFVLPYDNQKKVVLKSNKEVSA
jgi:phage shock protein C